MKRPAESPPNAICRQRINPVKICNGCHPPDCSRLENYLATPFVRGLPRSRSAGGKSDSRPPKAQIPPSRTAERPVCALPRASLGWKTRSNHRRSCPYRNLGNPAWWSALDINIADAALDQPAKVMSFIVTIKDFHHNELKRHQGHRDTDA